MKKNKKKNKVGRKRKRVCYKEPDRGTNIIKLVGIYEKF